MPVFPRRVYRQIVYPSVLRVVGEYSLYDRLDDLRAVQMLSLENLQRRQARRAAHILNYAASKSPYYRDKWPVTTPATASNSIELIKALPFLTKQDLQESQKQMEVPGLRSRTSTKITGGSTGQPVTIRKDRGATAQERAAMWLAYGWFGVRIGDRAARFWGRPYTTGRRLSSALGDFSMNRIRASAFAFGDAELAGYWNRCLRFSPDYLHGYVSMVETFAAFLLRRGHDGRRLRLKSVIVTSEVLSPPQRSVIEEAFGTKVQIEYGCGEAGPIAHECQAGQMHLHSENLFVEILKADGTETHPGETGEIVITDLHNRAVPLIRYKLGDFGIRGEPCDCGRGFPVLDKLWGRAYDFVETADGKRYHGEFFLYAVEDLRRNGYAISQFQIIQQERSSLQVLLVVPPANREEISRAVINLLRERLKIVEVQVRFVSSIPRSSSGKMRVIKNEIAN